MKIFVSVLTFNDNKDTLECLESLDKINKDKHELNVVVVDNASDKSFAINKRFKNFNLKIIRNKENLGFSGGHNVAIDYSLKNGADYVLILNNDTEVEKNFLIKLLNAFKGKTGIAVPKIYFAKGFEFHKDRYKVSQLGKIIWYAGGEMDWENVYSIHIGVDGVDKEVWNEKETEIATGCCMLVKREVFEKVGSLDDKYFLYYEDADFSVRVKKAGFLIVFVPDSIVWHKNAQSTGGSGSDLQDYYTTRNRLYFGFKYAPMRTRIALFKESLKHLFFGRKWQKIGVQDYYLGIIGKGSFKKE